jgi:hypothetical protein
MMQKMVPPPQSLPSAHPEDLSTPAVGKLGTDGSLFPAQARRWTLWLGPGIRPDLAERIEAGPELQGQGRLQRNVVDLADLLGRQIGPGRLLAFVADVPTEDIGILRRFLERDSARELVLFSSGDEVAPMALLTLPRTRVLPKPISAAALAWLVGVPEQLERRLMRKDASPKEGEAPMDPGRVDLALQVLKERLSNRDDVAPLLGRLEIELNRTRGEIADAESPVDVGELAEEILASLSLERGRRTRFLFRPEGELSVVRNRDGLGQCLKGLFKLVGRCSTPDSVIRVRVTSQSGDEPDPDALVEVYVEFPDSPLQGIAVGDELDPLILASHFGPEVAGSVRCLLRDAEQLDARVSAAPTRPGRRGIRLCISRLPRLPAHLGA